MALWVHRHLQLKEEEVFIISAGYKPPISFGTVIPAFSDTQSGLIKKFTKFNVSRAFDKYLEAYIGNKPFTAYIDIMHTYQKLLVTHGNCRAFHFMEEGTDSYMQALTLKDFTRTSVSARFRIKSNKALLLEMIRTSRGYSSALHSLPYHAQSYQYQADRRYFCLSDFCYPGVAKSQKVLLEPQLNIQETELLALNERLSDAIIVIDETYPDIFEIPRSEYKRVLSRAIDMLKERDTKIFIKERPNADGNSTLSKILKDLDLSFEVLRKEVLAEGLFLNSERLKVVGFVSLLLFYAKIFGHTSYSMSKGLRNKPKSRFDRIEGFDTMVEFLD